MTSMEATPALLCCTTLMVAETQTSCLQSVIEDLLALESYNYPRNEKVLVARLEGMVNFSGEDQKLKIEPRCQIAVCDLPQKKLVLFQNMTCGCCAASPAEQAGFDYPRREQRAVTRAAEIYRLTS